MNFKTTVVLIGLLAVVALGVVFVQWEAKKKEDPTAVVEEKTLLGVKSGDVVKVAVTPRGGQRVVMEKEGAEWKLTEPVKAGADAFAVDALVRAVAEMKSRGEAELTSENASAAGLEQPRFVVELTDKDGKTTKVKVGNVATVGGNLYVQPEGAAKAMLVAAEVNEQLEKPYTAYRQTRLVNVQAGEIRQLSVTRPNAPKLVLEKRGEQWEVVEPTKMPAEASEVSSLTSAVSFLNAVEFVPEEEVSPFVHPKNAPRATVWVSKETPATQPSASNPASTQPSGVTVAFGGYDSNLKKNLYVSVSDPAALAKVPATAVEAFNKTALDLRDRKVVDVDPEQVTKVEIVKEGAESSATVIERKKADLTLGPAVPATQPTGGATTQPTTMASTQPTTAPALPDTKWALVTPTAGDASEAEVKALLAKFHPLRAQKYVEGAAVTTQPVATWRVKITAQPAGAASPVVHEVVLREKTGGGALVGSYQSLAFEVDRSVMEAMTKDFKNKAEEKPAAEEGMPGGLPAGFPGLPPGHP